MAGPSAIFTEMVTTTLRNSPKEIADNVSKHNALLNILKKKGKIINLDGGSEIQIPLEYGENSTYLYIAQHKDAQWSQDDEKKPVNQDAVVIPYFWQGNMVCSNRSLQGVLLDAA
jgi:hypothetical protein